MYAWMCVGPHFGGSLIDALQSVCKKFDGDRISHFELLRKSQIFVISAVVSRSSIHIYSTYVLHTYKITFFLTVYVLNYVSRRLSGYLWRNQRLQRCVCMYCMDGCTYDI